MQRACLIQDREGFAVIAIAYLELCEFQERLDKSRQLGMSSPERVEIFQSPITSTESEIESRQIALRECTAWRRRISCPALEIGAGRLVFETLKPVQLLDSPS